MTSHKDKYPVKQCDWSRENLANSDIRSILDVLQECGPMDVYTLSDHIHKTLWYTRQATDRLLADKVIVIGEDEKLSLTSIG